MQYYKLTLTTLSPVHIGSGDTYTRLDYAYDSEHEKVYIMDPYKLFCGLQKHKCLERLQKSLDKDTDITMTKYLKDCGISPLEYRDWAAYSYDISNIDMNSKRITPKKSNMNIASFVKDAYGLPYLPGSSLKGAIRTAFAYGEICKDTNKWNNIRSMIESEVPKSPKNKSYLRKPESELQNRLFYTLQRDVDNRKNAVNDFFSGIRIGDSKPLSLEKITLCQKIDVHWKGRKNKINVLREALKPATIATFDLEIDTDCVKTPVNEILADINKMYDKYTDAFKIKFETCK